MSDIALIMNGKEYDLPYDTYGTVNPVRQDNQVIDVKVITWSVSQGTGPDGPRIQSN